MLASQPGTVRQRGFSLLEGLIAIVVFSLGALGMIEMQARAVQLSMDAQDRSNASFLINKLISQVALQDTASGALDPSEAYVFVPRQYVKCSDGVPSSHPAVTWMREVCATFDDAEVLIARPDGVDKGFLEIVIAWKGRYKNADAGGVIRDEHRMAVTNRFQWQQS